MALVPIPSANADIDLQLGNIPQDLSDPQLLYEELLNLHTALEILLTKVDELEPDTGTLTDYINKQRGVTATGSLTYYIAATDGMVLLSGLANACTAVLPVAADVAGHRYTIKCVDDTHAVDVLPSGVETIDGDAGSFQLWKDEVIEVQSYGAGWQIR